MNMGKRILAIASGLAALAVVAYAADSGIKRAEEYFRRTEYERARRAAIADSSSMDRSSLAAALLMLARIETDYAKAEAFYRRVMASENERAADRARLDLATMRYATGDYAGALELLSEGKTEGSERDAEKAAYFAALCRRQLGDNTRAAADFAEITRGEYAAWSLLARAEIDAQEGRLAEAIGKYEGVARSHRSPIAIFKLAECFEQLGEREKALDRYRSLIDEFPRSLEAGRANEKIQLIAASMARMKDEKQAGGGESGVSSAREATAPAGEEGRFTIQFGSFGAKANALAVSDKLDGMFRGVRVERFELEGRVMHRVRVGIYESRESAARDIARAKERLGLAGVIVPLQ
jgi:tetratricopeptide (TPR) repeat protein